MFKPCIFVGCFRGLQFILGLASGITSLPFRLPFPLQVLMGWFRAYQLTDGISVRTGPGVNGQPFWNSTYDVAADYLVAGTMPPPASSLGLPSSYPPPLPPVPPPRPPAPKPSPRPPSPPLPNPPSYPSPAPPSPPLPSPPSPPLPSPPKPPTNPAYPSIALPPPPISPSPATISSFSQASLLSAANPPPPPYSSSASMRPRVLLMHLLIMISATVCLVLLA